MTRKEVDILNDLWRFSVSDRYTDKEIRKALDMAIEALKQERPHGEWVETSNIWETEDLSGWGYWKECSSCHCQEKRRTSFCPNCGASMVSSNSKTEKSKSKICPCIECCELDNSEPCRKGCADYQKWKEGDPK